MDIDGNGLIDLEEFCLCMARYIARKQQQKAPPAPKQSLSTKQLRDAFNYFDKVGLLYWAVSNNSVLDFLACALLLMWPLHASLELE